MKHLFLKIFGNQEDKPSRKYAKAVVIMIFQSYVDEVKKKEKFTEFPLYLKHFLQPHKVDKPWRKLLVI